MNVDLESEQQIELLPTAGKSRGSLVVRKPEEDVIFATTPPVEEASLVWNKLSYGIRERELWPCTKWADVFRAKEKTVLHEQCGELTTGTLTAVLGKSGSGKTTLIESLAGRRVQGLKGTVSVSVKVDSNVSFSNDLVKITFIPQQDDLLQSLTVEESICYASKLKNCHVSFSNFHLKMTDEMTKQLDLEKCRRVYVRSCSGGQRKRLSIAMELVSRPTILILDEPTSGLDSCSALQCVQLLRKLADSNGNRLSVLATIHQPNSDILFLFHQVYLLSHDGRRIFYGPVTKLLPHFSKHQLICPEYHNPADFAIEIASGGYGQEVILEMAKSEAATFQSSSPTDTAIRTVSITSVVDSLSRKSLAVTFNHIGVLFRRTLLMTVRDPVLSFLRVFQHIFIAIVIMFLYNGKIGEEGGCAFDNMPFDLIMEKQTMTTQNVTYFFFMSLFLCFASMMPTIMIFPLEMQVFLKERSNGWYSAASYYVAKTFADMPFQMFYSTIFVLITYYATGQVHSYWRFFSVLTISLTLSAVGQSYGLLVGAIFADNLNAAMFLGPQLAMTFVLVCGFFSKISTTPLFLQPIAYASFMRYGFEGTLVSIYGHGRCNLVNREAPKNVTFSPTELCIGLVQFLGYLKSLNISYPMLQSGLEGLVYQAGAEPEDLTKIEEQVMKVSDMNLDLYQIQREEQNETFSGVMKEYDLHDGLLYHDVMMLLLIFVILRILTYIIILIRSNKRK